MNKQQFIETLQKEGMGYLLVHNPWQGGYFVKESTSIVMSSAYEQFAFMKYKSTGNWKELLKLIRKHKDILDL